MAVPKIVCFPNEKLCIWRGWKKYKVFGPPGFANGKSVSNLEETGVGVNF